MKKIRYVATMVVEVDIDEATEREMYPNGLTEESLKEEMKSDSFHDIFYGTLTSYKAEGTLIVDGKEVAKHNENYDD